MRRFAESALGGRVQLDLIGPGYMYEGERIGSPSPMLELASRESNETSSVSTVATIICSGVFVWVKSGDGR